jgi:uncharacterized Tic20 family protein
MLLSPLLSCGPTVLLMTEPPRPPGEGNPSDPTAPFNPYSGNEPTPESAPPPPPAYGAPQPPAYGSPQPPAYGSPPPGSGAGGYAPPPSSGAGGYPPPPGSGAPPPQYGAPQYGAPQYGQPAPNAAQEDKTWILVAHFGGAAGALIGGGTLGWIAPLVAMLARGQQSPFVRSEAIKALNFQILWSIIAVVCWVLTCIVIGAFLAPIAALIAIIFGVIAGVKASNNEPYNYPMSYNFIK